MAKTKTKIKVASLIVSFLLMSMGLIQTTYAVPPSIGLCEENAVSEGGAKICKNGDNLACDNTTVNQTSTDKKYLCNGTEWTYCKAATKDTKSPDKSLICDGSIWKAGNPPPPDNSCPTVGSVSNDESKICQSDKTWLACSSGNSGDTVSGKQCTSGKWLTPKTPDGDPVDGGGKNPLPPTAKITKNNAFPSSFNPTIENTKISYTINQKATIELKITDKNGQTIDAIVDNTPLSEGSYSAYWYGTKGNKQSGTVLPPGTYHYKIIAKNQKTDKVEDSKEGDINLVYTTGGGLDPEDKAGDKTGANTKSAADQAAATLALQNAKKGKTAKTGPGILIYSVLPLATYVYLRRKK